MVDVEHHRANGFSCLPGAFDRYEVAALLAAIETATDPREQNDLTEGAMRFTSNLYRRSDAVRSLLADPRITDLVTTLLGPDTWCRWDQAVCKGPGAGTFPWHQDNGYTRLDHEHLQVWLALTDAPPERGGLWVAPGAHRASLAHRQVGPHVELVDPITEVVPLAALAGDVIAFSSFLPHHTSPNATDHLRWAYVAEFLPSTVDDASVPFPRFEVTRAGRPVGTLRPDGPGAPGRPT